MYAVIKEWGITPILLSVRETLDEAKEILGIYPRAIITDRVRIELEPVTHYLLTWNGWLYGFRGPGTPFSSVRLIAPYIRGNVEGGLPCLRNS